MTDYEDITTYKRGSTFICKATVTNPDTDALTDPSSITCGFTQPDGTAVAGVAMVKDSTGLYHYDYAIGAAALQGVWIPVVTATTGARVRINEDEFLVT